MMDHNVVVGRPGVFSEMNVRRRHISKDWSQMRCLDHVDGVRGKVIVSLTLGRSHGSAPVDHNVGVSVAIALLLHTGSYCR